MKSVLIVIFIIVIVLSLYIYPKHENFEDAQNIETNRLVQEIAYNDTVLSTLLTPQSISATVTDNLEDNNTPCFIPLGYGKNHEFKAAGTKLDWYKVYNKPRACAIEMSSLDMNNNPANCSQTNAKMYDPNIVKDIYLKGTFDGFQRCEIEFKDNVTQEQLDAYTRNLRSHKVYSDCDKFKKDVIRLEAENKSTNEKIAQSKKNIVVANELANLKKAEAADKAAKSAALEKQASEDRSKAEAELNAAKFASKEAENARLERQKLEQEKVKVKTEGDKALIELRIASLKNAEDTAKDTAKMREKNASQLQELASKNQQIADVNKKMSDNAIAQADEMKKIAVDEKNKIDAAKSRQNAANEIANISRDKAKEYDVKNDFMPYNNEIYVPASPNFVLSVAEPTSNHNNMTVSINERWNGDVQKWTMDSEERLVNNKSKKCLTYNGPNSQARVNTCTDNENQKWYYDNKQRLHPKSNPNSCLDVYGSRYANGQSVYTWNCHDGQNQKWRVQTKQDEDSRLNRAKVTLYQHTAYNGYKSDFTVGSYRKKDLQARGVLDNDISSIKVPVGLRARLFEEDDFGGREISTSQDIYDFTSMNINFNDKLSSMIVEKDANTIRDSYDMTNERNRNFNPLSLTNYVYQGCYRDNWSRALPKWLGNISSVDQCYTLAKNNQMTYFGTQWNSECWGGNDTSYNKHGMIREQECKYECTGRGGQGGITSQPTCGGGWANAVYKINK